MGTCLVEDASTYCQTTNIMEQTASSTTLDSAKKSDNPRCLFNSHKNNSKFILNQETTRKRRSSEVESSDDNATIIVNRPTSLSLINSTNDNSCSISPVKFQLLSELSSPSTKRLRPQTLSFTPTCSSLNTNSNQSSIDFISPTELANKIREKIPMTIYDCGSPFRHSEHRICNSILLYIANKLSRKRFKINSQQNASFDTKQLNESQFIILYDDNTNNSRSNPNQISSVFKCAREQIEGYLTKGNSPSILILSCSFNDFFDLYPNLCESLQPRSCPSSPKNHSNELSSPQTAPPIKNSFSSSTNHHDIDNHPMTHIIDGLYIGSETDAKNLQQLSSEEIRYVVNVTSHVPLYHSEQIKYCHIPADDTQKQNLLEYFDKAYSFIHNAIENNEKILVHCVAGISRSPAIVIGFLMRYANMSMNDAYDFVKRKRSIVSPNLNFMGQLLEYEKKLKFDKK